MRRETDRGATNSGNDPHFSRLVILKRLQDFLLRVHHKRTVAHHWFVERFPGQHQQIEQRTLAAVSTGHSAANVRTFYSNPVTVKLARRAAVPVVPLALVTDAWANGEFLKDFGKIDPTKTVRFSFGAPIAVNGGGGDQNQQIIHYIASKLDGWKESPAN